MGVCISSSHLHIFSSSHLLIFTPSVTPSHLHIFSSSHLLIFTSSHLHIFSSSHLLIFTCLSSHSHTFSLSRALTPSHTHIFSLSPLSSLLSLSPFSLPFLSLAFFICQLGGSFHEDRQECPCILNLGSPVCLDIAWFTQLRNSVSNPNAACMSKVQ